MNELTIWFKDGAQDGDVVHLYVLDVVVQQGFLVAFLPEDEEGNHISNAYNIGLIDSWRFVQVKKGDEDGEEGISEE